MANVILAARTMATAAFDAGTSGAVALAATAEIGAIYATDKRDQIREDLEQSAVERQILAKSQRAENIAQHYIALDERLAKNKKLKLYYDKALASLNKSETQAIAAE